MRRALDLAAQADHRTSPNPMVGAVVLDVDGIEIAVGHHERAGLAHAEAGALQRAGGRARGGTLYVTLEPCGFHGRTPPCVDVILASGVKRVVIAMLDPDPRVNGQSVERLLESGLQISVGIAEMEARKLTEFYIKQRQTGRPFVSAKFAASLDGKIATAGGESRWITGPEARRHGHRLRHIHDAILVGVGTVLADDPELSARNEGARQPLRIVLDSTLRTPPEAAAAGPNTIFVTTDRASREARERLQQTGAEVLQTGGRQPDLAWLLDELGRRNLLSLLVEGGAEVHGSFFDQRLVDRVYAYLAPTIIGGADAKGPVGGIGAASLAEAMRLGELEVESLGPDLLITATKSSAGQPIR